MASAREYSHRHIRAETRIELPGSELEDNASFEQQPRGHFDARRHTATETGPGSDGDGEARDVLNRRSVSTDSSTILEDALMPPPVTRPNSVITKITEPSHRDLQDERSGLFSHMRLIDEHLDCDSRPAKSAPATRDEFHPSEECPTRRKFSTSRLTWLNGSIVFICSVSTALSAIFVYLALKGQRYGSNVGNDPGAKMSISTAILWTSIAAKTIELSSVTSFVTLLGQVVSRRAFVDSNSQGITLSELIMWRWVVQPGTLLSQPEIAKYAGLSSLGILTLLSTILSTLYVTAATALVQPIQKQSDWNSKTLVGSVKTDFANANYIGSLCRTPITNDDQSEASCLQIDHAGKNYYNLATFLSNWNRIVESNNSVPIEQHQRPSWIGLPYANATVVPQWINIINTTEVSEKYQRVINNVSLAMPHIGVSNAVRDQRNVMPQSETSDSVKAYSLWASVPSPVMKVLCTTLNKTELAPIIYETWNNQSVGPFNWDDLRENATTKNSTVVDDLFGWTKQTRSKIDYPPVFPRYPDPFNTILNYTELDRGRTAIYLLGQGGLMDDGTDLTGEYPLCKLEAGISPHCSTLYSVAVSGNKIQAVCEDQAGDMAYIRTNPKAQTVQGVPNWLNVGYQWANSLSLNKIVDGTFGTPRLLMGLQPASKILDARLSQKLPSLAETLAVTASYTLLTGWQEAPFVDVWNYTYPILEEAQPQWFSAKIQSQEYASGGVDDASKGWLVILISTLLLNVFILGYFIVQPGLVTDFSQPPQLFALAMNSPPTRALAGSCGGGPEGKQYKVSWSINHQGRHLSMEPASKESVPLYSKVSTADTRTTDRQSVKSEAQTRGGLLSIIPRAFGRAKLRAKPRTKRSGGSNAASRTELLRPSGGNKSAGSLQSDYELGEFNTPT